MKRLIELIQSSKRWNTALWVGIVLFLALSLLGISSRQDDLRLRSVELSIEPGHELAFIDSLKVMEIIKGPDSSRMLTGLRLGDLHIDRMESDLERYPFIEKADVALDLSGRLIIKIRQRHPVLRIISNRGQSYYVANNGYKMPLHPGFAPRVLTANGNIAETLTDTAFVSGKTGLDLLRIASYCSRDAFWRSQIEQLYVDNYMDILLIPKVGNHSIVFGSADDLEEKFSRLKTFYTEGLNVVGWDKYQRIDLRFKGQVVAEKK